MRNIQAALLLLMLSAVGVQAEVREVYDFDTRAEEQRYQNLIAELRCPKCQNQNIADSNAPISKDMRDQVYRLMKKGASNDEIVGDLVGRFGEFVQYKPPVDKRTILLWAFPAIAVITGVAIVAGVAIRSRKREEEESALSPDELARVKKMLADKDQQA